MALKITEELRKKLYNAVLGDSEAKIAELDEAFRTETADQTEDPTVEAISAVLASRQAGKPTALAKMQLAVEALSPAKLEIEPRDLDGLSADQMRRLFAANNVDLFAGLQKDRTFPQLLDKVVQQTYKNAFDRILQEGAKSAVREATLDLLRKCYVSVAAGSTLSDLVAAIEGTKPAGGSEGGDAPSGRAGLP
ncbi:MAG: hypothetical protein K2X03_28670 [Bryobacteraceae bacterium]|nr:hypothetical protein [Bryobacteraceae bacterium]